MQKLLLTGSDVFYALNETRTDDLGRTLERAGRAPGNARQADGARRDDRRGL